MPPSSETLDRFHQVLLQEISESRPEYLTKPFTVAEIYQNLVPYRSHRDLIGVEMNGDYEDILLRLLAGEGDYLLLDSEVARREIRQELENAAPNTGLFRDFAAADVRLNPDRILASAGEVMERETVDIAELRPDAVSDGVVGHIELADVGFLVPMPGTEADDLDSEGDDPGAGDPAAATDSPVLDAQVAEAESGYDEESVQDRDYGQGRDLFQSEEQAPSDEIEEQGETPTEVSDEDGPSACHWCRQSLPSRELLNFCPFCGSDLRLTPCPTCGEELETGWQFCISCGTGVSE